LFRGQKREKKIFAVRFGVIGPGGVPGAHSGDGPVCGMGGETAAVGTRVADYELEECAWGTRPRFSALDFGGGFGLGNHRRGRGENVGGGVAAWPGDRCGGLILGRGGGKKIFSFACFLRDPRHGGLNGALGKLCRGS